MKRIILISLLFFQIINCLQAQTKRFVNINATGTGDGSSWTNAYTNFQTAINASSAGDSVFVAKGTYQPASGQCYSMKEGVKIYGHFAGTETSLAERNLSSTDTTKLLGNGICVILNMLNNLTVAAILDGFTITGGKDNGTGYGGGIYNSNSSSPTISNCVFINNTSSDAGGAIANNFDCSPIIYNCIFINNSTVNGGGAIFNYRYCSPIISGCKFIGNSTTNSNGYGGAIYTWTYSSSIIINCIFKGNSTFWSGGAIYSNWYCKLVITNCVLTENKTTASNGGTIGSEGFSTMSISNSIIWGNSSSSIYSDNSFNITYSDNEYGYSGAGNVNASPLFVDSANGNYHLSCNSPCINAGNSDSASHAGITTDLGGGIRTQGSSVDMGVYESQGTVKWTGNTNTDWNTASNWDINSTPLSSACVVIPSTTNTPINSITNDTVQSIVIQTGGKLTVTGLLTAADSITVAPDASLVASSNNINGAVSLQQNIIGQRGWRAFANPFNTATDIATTASNNGITIATTPYTLSGLTDSRTFDNNTNAWSNVTGTTWAANTPYALFIRGQDSNFTSIPATNNYSHDPAPFVYKVSGVLNNSSVTIAPSSASNFIMVGNPYAAPVNSLALTGGGISSYYVYQISQTATPQIMSGGWSAVLTSNTTNTIPVLGVVAYIPSSTTNFTISTNDINTGGTKQTTLFGGNDATIKNVELEVDKDGYYADKMFLRQDENATENGTDKNDLKKFYNDNVNIYAIDISDSSRLGIDARKEFNSPVPLGMYGSTGNYTIKLISNSLNDTKVILRDKLLNTETELNDGVSYKFSITDDTSSKGEQRFELVFNSTKTSSILNTSDEGNLKAEILGNIINTNILTIKVEDANNQKANLFIKDESGRNIINANVTNGINKINIASQAAGMLFIQLNDGKKNVILKAIKQ